MKISSRPILQSHQPNMFNQNMTNSHRKLEHRLLHSKYKYSKQGAKKITFTACHSGKLKLAFTSPDVILTSPKNVLASRIDFTVLLLFEFLKKHHLPIGQVKNRIHKPDSKIHQPQAIGHYFLCTLSKQPLKRKQI